MIKKLPLASVLVASLSIVVPAFGATISWTLPASYSDGTPIDPSDVRQIRVKVYRSPDKAGPWRWAGTSRAGATSMQVADPRPGRTLWYTVKSSLHGVESGFAEPVRKTNFNILPIAKKVMRKLITPRKMTALFFLLLFGGLAWFLMHRGKGGKG